MTNKFWQSHHNMIIKQVNWDTVVTPPATFNLEMTQRHHLSHPEDCLYEGRKIKKNNWCGTRQIARHIAAVPLITLLTFSAPVWQGTIYSWHQGHWQLNIKDHTRGVCEKDVLHCLDHKFTQKVLRQRWKLVMPEAMEYLGKTRTGWKSKQVFFNFFF